MISNVMINKAKYFSDEGAKVHISCSNSRFYNGIIKSIKETFLIIDDRIYGETPVYFEEIKGIERYTEEKK